MIKILLISDDKSIKDRIIKTLSREEFDIHLSSGAESPDSIPIDSIKLIIADTSALKNNVKNHILNSLKPAGQINNIKNTAKIAVLDPAKENSLPEYGIQFDDFCFLSRIEKELLFRTRAVLSRMNIYPPKNSIIIGELLLDLDKYSLSVKGIAIELTFKEFEFLKLLLENQNKVFTRDKLLSIIWEYDFYGGSRTIDVHMRRLRSKIPPPYNLMLKTVRNVGYMFSPQI